ncbi:hypothetical protein B566_EDAN007144 [Ephemera danica]|nr:hypothetical protein B566_EDAN007144 [Ephemera danica]
MASGSQDTYIRLWRISPVDSTEPHKPVSQLAPDEEIKPEQKVFLAHGRGFAYKLESVLLGHAAWVHSVTWHPTTNTDVQPPQLLSSAMDATVCVWTSDVDSGVWSPSARLGLIKEDSLGIQGCVWGPLGSASILAHTIQGSMHLWTKVADSWESGFTVGGGHFGEVLDLCWEPGGEFLLSVGTDQTTRVHAPWRRPEQKPEEVWHELSRPQVHGYDLTCIAPISRYRFASGAEEKIIRCFQASKQFKLCLKHITKVEVADEECRFFKLHTINCTIEGAQSASVPILGLSNLSVSDVEQAEGALLLHGLEDTSEPLREEVLWRGTLWPEERKLYGHGYEIYCLAASNSGHLLASASRATLPEHAAIILWDTRTWQEVQKLPAHQLTVTQMAFSPDDQFLLSVSRDRRISLFRRTEATGDGAEQFTLFFSTDKRNGIHTRIIWTCAWSKDSMFFATGSREGTVIVWSIKDGQVAPASPPLTLSHGVTAVAFAPELNYLLAVGTDDGSIALYEWKPSTEPESWSLRIQLDKQYPFCSSVNFVGSNYSVSQLCTVSSSGHHKTVKRLAFRPSHNNILQLASCGCDHAVKIHSFCLS